MDLDFPKLENIKKQSQSSHIYESNTSTENT